jgi:hypothetical protein
MAGGANNTAAVAATTAAEMICRICVFRMSGLETEVLEQFYQLGMEL